MDPEIFRYQFLFLRCFSQKEYRTNSDLEVSELRVSFSTILDMILIEITITKIILNLTVYVGLYWSLSSTIPTIK